jgi:hypothetical protein
MKIKVNVTAKEIKNGKAGKCDQCPVSLAFLKTFNGITSASVFAHEINLYSEETHQQIKTPKKVNEFVCNFDSGLNSYFQNRGDKNKAKPFSFFINIRKSVSEFLKPKKQYIVR